MKITINIHADQPKRKAVAGDLIQSEYGEVGVCFGNIYGTLRVLWLPRMFSTALSEQSYQIVPEGSSITLTQEAT